MVVDLAYERGRASESGWIPELEAATTGSCRNLSAQGSNLAATSPAAVEVIEADGAVLVDGARRGGGLDAVPPTRTLVPPGVRERRGAVRWHARAGVDSEPGAGTTITLTLPAYHLGGRNPFLEVGRLVGLGRLTGNCRRALDQ